MFVLSWRAWQAHLAPRSNHQLKDSSNGTIFMQLAPPSTNQSTRLNGAIFMSHWLFTSWAWMSILSFPRMHMTIQTSRRPHRAPTNNQSTPQTALSSCSWRLAPPTISTPLNRAISMLHSLFTSWASESIVSILACIWQAAHATGALHRPSTKYSFNGPIHDACEGRKGWTSTPCLSSLGIVGLEPIHLSSAGRVSPKSMWSASSSNPFATIYTYGYIVKMRASWSME